MAPPQFLTQQAFQSILEEHRQKLIRLLTIIQEAAKNGDNNYVTRLQQIDIKYDALDYRLSRIEAKLGITPQDREDIKKRIAQALG